MSIFEQLDLTARVAAAEPSIRGWGLQHPAGSQLETFADLVEGLRGGSPGENDRLLLRLAELAHVEAGDSVDAAAVLARLVLPAVAARLRRCGPVSVPGEVDRHAAALLWIACRTFPYRGRHWVATTIGWRVFRAVQQELGHGAGEGRTWAATVVAGDPSWWADDAPAPDPEPDPADDVADLLQWAADRGVVSSEELVLVSTLLRVSRDLPVPRRTRHGLLSKQISELVAAEVGIGPATVRRRVAEVLVRLNAAGPAYLSMLAS